MTHDIDLGAVSRHELNTILSGLIRLRTNLRNAHKRNLRMGWKPPEGNADLNAVRMATVEKLIKRWERIQRSYVPQPERAKENA